MEKITLTTPVGEAQWFSLTKVDKFGNYTCNLTLDDSPETHKLVSKIKELANGKPIKFITKDESGKLKLKMKLKSTGQKKTGESYEKNPPAIYDQMGQRLTAEKLAGLSVGNGSLIRAKLEVYVWEYAGNTGVACKPLSVQIKKLVVFEGQDSENLGFDAFELESTDEVPENNEEETGNYDF